MYIHTSNIGEGIKNVGMTKANQVMPNCQDSTLFTSLPAHNKDIDAKL